MNKVLIGAAIMAIILGLAVVTVPQEWAGALVGWLLFLAVAGLFVLRLALRHYQGKAHSNAKRIVHTPTRRTKRLRVAVMRQSSGRRNI